MRPFGPACHASAGILSLQSFLGLLALPNPGGGCGGGGVPPLMSSSPATPSMSAMLILLKCGHCCDLEGVA
eukprot:6398430-Karenia_brevis.AAC.1